MGRLPNGRNRDGRFAKGCKPGPGNPRAAKVEALRAALFKAVTAKDIAELAEAMLKAAKAGDMNAAKLLLSYLIGPAKSPDVELDGGDLLIRFPANGPQGIGCSSAEGA